MPQSPLLERIGIPAGLAAAAVGYFTFVDGPKRDAAAAAAQELSNRERYISEAEELRPRIAKARHELSESLAHIAQWREGTPTAHRVADFYGTLHRALREGGASVLRFEPQPPISLETLEQTPVAVTVVGSHEAIHRALVEVEGLPVTIWVKDARLSRAGEDEKKVQLEAKLVIFAERAEKSH